MSKVLYQTTVTSEFWCSYGFPYQDYPVPLNIKLPQDETIINVNPNEVVTIPAFPSYSNTVYATTMEDSITIASNIMMNNYLSNNFIETILTKYPQTYDSAYNTSENYPYNLDGLNNINIFTTTVVDYNTNYQNVITTIPVVGTFPVFKFVPNTINFQASANITSKFIKNGTITAPPQSTVSVDNNELTNYGTLNGWIQANNILLESEYPLLPATTPPYSPGTTMCSITNTVTGYMAGL